MFCFIDKKEIAKLARWSIEFYLERKSIPSVDEAEKLKPVGSIWDQNFPAFVVITSKYKNTYGSIRGSWGSLDKARSLKEMIMSASVNAAFFDHRTPRIRRYEMNEIRLEIIILSGGRVLGEINFEKSYVPGGIYKGRISILLPHEIKELVSIDQIKNLIRLRLGIRSKKESESIQFFMWGYQLIKEKSSVV